MTAIGAKMKFTAPRKERPFRCGPVSFMVERRYG